MNAYTWIKPTYTLVRVSKAAARKVWEAGGMLALCPAKLSPIAYDGAFRCHVDKASAGDKCVRDENTPHGYHHVPRTFDDVVSLFVVYNCNSNETGSYTQFYIVEGK